MSDNRDVYLDYIKAFGIGLVVLGHTEVFPSEVTTVIFAFHMPIFFFCSGCLFKGYRKGQVVKCLKRYLLRYVFYAILFSVSFQLLKFGNLDILKEAKSLVLGKYDVYNPACIIWFLMCLFTVEIIAIILSRINLSRWIIVSLIFICPIIGFLFCELPNHSLPFRLQTAFVALSFFCFGWVINEHLSAYRLWLKKRILIAVLLIIVLFALLIGIALLNGRTGMNSDLYNSPFLFILSAYIGIVFVVTLSEVLPANMKLVKMVGENTLVVYIGHLYPIVMIRLLFEKLGYKDSLKTKLIAFAITYSIILAIMIVKTRRKSGMTTKTES